MNYDSYTSNTENIDFLVLKFVYRVKKQIQKLYILYTAVLAVAYSDTVNAV
jgi:hypothetical protein